MEVFDMAGLVDPFVKAANRATSVAVIAHGKVLARVPFTPPDSPYSYIAMVPQNVTEELLVDELKRKDGNIEYDTSFVSAAQDHEYVKAILQSKSETMECRTRFLVGCDGAHSAIRRWLRLPFEGAAYESLFMLADIETNGATPANELQMCPSGLGPLAMFPMNATRLRIVGTVSSKEGDAPSLEFVRKILERRGPEGLEARALHWSSYFHIHHRRTPRLRVGRVFLAGDAAHVHSPFGGQGMNTGLQDVWNLVWKLDLCLRGDGNEGLLDSYESERLPVIHDVIRTTHYMTKVMGNSSRIAQALRDIVLPWISRLPAFRQAFVDRLSELAIAYSGSPIVDGRGERWFDDSLRGGNSIGRRFLLIADEETPARKLAEAFPNVIERRWSRASGVRLIRPDGYIAYSGGNLDQAGQVLKRQLHVPGSVISAAA